MNNHPFFDTQEEAGIPKDWEAYRAEVAANTTEYIGDNGELIQEHTSGIRHIILMPIAAVARVTAKAKTKWFGR